MKRVTRDEVDEMFAAAEVLAKHGLDRAAVRLLQSIPREKVDVRPMLENSAGPQGVMSGELGLTGKKTVIGTAPSDGFQAKPLSGPVDAPRSWICTDRGPTGRIECIPDDKNDDDISGSTPTRKKRK
jgi:hypothetical protein